MSKKHPKHLRASAAIRDACNRVQSLADRRVGREVDEDDIIAGIELAVGRRVNNRELVMAAYRKFEDAIVADALEGVDDAPPASVP